jgi:hypothetical protein
LSNVIFLVGTIQSQQGEADRHQWKDGRLLFDLSTSKMRKLLAKKSKEEHVAFRRWRQEIPGVPSPSQNLLQS